MKSLFLKSIPISLLLAFVTAENTSSKSTLESPDNTAPEGFSLLFNGKDLSNWQGVMYPPYDKPHKRAALLPEEAKEQQAKTKAKMLKHWSVTDKGELFFDGAKGGFSLATLKKYRNFELHVSWRLEEHGDSGVYLRGLPQVQIWDTESPKTQKHGAAKGSGGLWNNRNAGRWPLVKADNPVGEWNHFVIRMIGDDVSIWLNGKQTVDKSPLINLWQKGKPLPEREQIELQCHGDPVWFKNIYIKELED